MVGLEKLLINQYKPKLNIVDKYESESSIPELNLNWIEFSISTMTSKVKSNTRIYSCKTIYPHNTGTIDYHDFKIRFILDKHSEPWFLVQDICGIINVHSAAHFASELNIDEKFFTTFGIGNYRRKKTFISEWSVYYLLFKSRKPGAKELSQWLFKEGIPEIRKSIV